VASTRFKGRSYAVAGRARLVVLWGAALTACSPSARPDSHAYAPEISPENFTAVVDNPFFPLEPGVEEHKYYVRGAGLVLEDEGGARIELTGVTRGAQGE